MCILIWLHAKFIEISTAWCDTVILENFGPTNANDISIARKFRPSRFLYVRTGAHVHVQYTALVSMHATCTTKAFVYAPPMPLTEYLYWKACQTPKEPLTLLGGGSG